MNEIERRFMPIDKYLSKYLREYNKINKNTQDTLQNIFNELDITYSDLNKPIPESKKNRLNRRLEKLLKEKEDNYMWFLLNQTLNKRKITYRELLEMYILSAYYEERKSLDDYDNVFFYSALETTYNQAIADIRKLKPKRKLRNEIFNWSILYTILNIPLLYGTKEAYLYGLALTNANEMYRKCLNDIQSQKELDIDNIGMQELLLKQRNKILSINDNKYSGAIENMVESYSNLAYLQCGLDNDVRKCKFIAQMDTRTTKMCESLNNQIFYLDKMNTYQRYSDLDKRIVTYHTKGMVRGENLPPIENHFHWCRSTITYNIEDTFIEKERKKLKPLKTINGVTFDNGIIDSKGIFHPIKGKEKIKVPSEDSKEFEFAKWIKENLGGDIHMVPELEKDIGMPDSFKTPQTPDYMWNNEKWDLKFIDGNTKNTIHHKFSDYKLQTDNIILKTGKTKMSNDEIIKYIEKEMDIYKNYYNKVIFINGNNIIKEFTNK